MTERGCPERSCPGIARESLQPVGMEHLGVWLQVDVLPVEVEAEAPGYVE